MGICVALAPLTIAADKKAERADRKPKVENRGENKKRAGGAQDGMKRIAEQLKLTPEQKEKLQPIFQEERKQLAELRAGSTLTPKERREKVQKIREEINAKVKPILSSEQLKVWAKLRGGEPRQSRRQK